MKRLLGILLSLVVIHGSDWTLTRLKYEFMPQHYDIAVTPYIYDNDGGPEWTFKGEVKINLKVMWDDVRKIEMHMYRLNITGWSSPDCDNDKSNSISGPPSYDENTQILTFRLDKSLKKDSQCVFRIEYNGIIANDMHGFYRSTYEEDGKVKRLAVTQFEDSYARRFIPCFDEPFFKATFTLSVRRRADMKSWSNMPIKTSTKDSRDGNFIIDTFQKTPLISTYMLALVVSEFEGEMKSWNGQIPFTVLSRPAMKSYSNYSLCVGQRVLKHFDDINKYPFKNFMPKMDMISTPDFSAGAMENPGLVTYRESLLLYDPLKATALQKKRIAKVVAHELAHMWFGNLVTCSWWSHTWLNEGFAKFFEQQAIPGVEISKDFPALFTVDSMHLALDYDSRNSTFPMTNNELKTHGDIRKMFSPISYQKGASVLRMLQYHINGRNGDSAFQTSLVQYIQDRHLKTAIPEDLIRRLIKHASFDTEDIFYTFTEGKSYPLIQVEINEARDEAILHQISYLTREAPVIKIFKADEEYTFKSWCIPITFVSKKQHSFNDTKTKVFMKRQKINLNITPVPNDWVIFNVQQIGYYRVNYDKKSWSFIIKALKSSGHDGIHELNRAQLINDVISLAKKDFINYCTAFELMSYMRSERSYIAWFAFLQGIGELSDRISDDDQNLLKGYINFMIENIYKDFSFIPDSSEKPMQLYHRALVFPVACRYHHSDCLTQARSQFKQLRANKSYQIPVEVRELVFCVAVREGDLDTFMFVWKLFAEEDMETEKITILSALGCTNNDKAIETFLDKIFSDEVRNNVKYLAFVKLARGNRANVQRVWDYVKKNHEKMSKILINGYEDVAKLAGTVISLMKTSQQLADVKKFCETNCDKFGDFKANMLAAEKNLKISLEWDSKHLNDVIKCMREHGGKSFATRISTNFETTLKFLILALFVFIM